MRTASSLRLRRLDPKQPWRLAALDAAPELALRRDNEMLIERIGMGQDLDPLAAAGNDREHRGPGRHNPHIVLQLRHVLRRPLLPPRMTTAA